MIAGVLVFAVDCGIFLRTDPVRNILGLGYASNQDGFIAVDCLIEREHGRSGT